jgi:DNA polymerase I-like protein with 3'-5' exonuclease and polymerase domains
MEAERRELESQGLAEFFFSHVMRLQPHLIGMTVGGVAVDALLKERITLETRAEVSALREKWLDLAREATGEPDLKVNPNSPKQLAELYFGKLRLHGRGVSTDATNRARMRSHPRTPAVARELLLTQDRYAEENKFLGTYAEMGIDDDGRVRCEYKQTGVVKAPGRLSSAAVLWGTGTNLQNQPERSHQMFVADRHCGFTYFDLSQAEARYVGWLAPIPAWIEQFEQARLGGNYDCHRALASVMYNVPYESVPAYDYDENHKPTIRYKSKRCRHALNYRMMPDRLAQELGITYPEAEDLFNIYHKTNPELRVWWKDTIEDVRRNRALYNSYGRRWILLERFDEDALESVIAFKPQSTIGDKVSRCIYLCESDPDWPHGRARIALNIHDALVALHYLDNATCEAVRVVMERHALEPITVRGYDGVERELIIPAEFKRSVADETGHHRWSTLKKVEHVTSSHTQTSGLVLH